MKNDLLSVDIDLSFDEIAKFSKSQFKHLVKKKLSSASKDSLRKQQKCHSKTANLVIKDNIQNYLISHKLTLIEKQNLYKLQARIVNVKNNYKSMYKDLKCIFCIEDNSIDCVEHYLKCSYLLNHKTLKIKIQSVNYSDLFKDIDSQTRFVRLWLQIEKERKLLTEARPEV